MFNNSKHIRTAMGLVKVEVPISMDPEAIEKILGEILEKDLGIPDALGEVSEEAERKYKVARYRWQYAITDELTPEQVEQAEKLDREEVFPGYTTFVERGKHQEYLSKYGEDMRAVHHLSAGSAKSIYRILTQGLMCTTERYSRGVMIKGMSSTIDIDTGGADSVFTRIANKAQREKIHGSVVVFKPEIFDRTDWYSYDSDNCGSTDDEHFARRLSPDAIFTQVTDPSFCPYDNEQMFRTGIGANFVESIEVDSHSRDEIIAELRSMGLEEIGGRPIEEVVVLRQTTQSEMAPSPTGNHDALIELNKKKAEKQAKMQALIDGKGSYVSIDELNDLASAGDDFNDSFKAMVESIIAHGEKEKLANDMIDFIKKNMNIDELKALATEEVLDGYSSEDMEMFSYIQNILGIDYSAIYEMALASQPEATPETSTVESEITPEPWPDRPDDWGKWDIKPWPDQPDDDW